MVEEVGLLIAGEGALEALVLEGFAWRPGDVVGPFGFALLNGLHLNLNTGVLRGVVEWREEKSNKLDSYANALED